MQRSSNVVQSNGVNPHVQPAPPPLQSQQPEPEADYCEKGGWGDDVEHSTTYTRGNSLVTPVVVAVSPLFVMVLVYTIIKLDGNIGNLMELVRSNGPTVLFVQAWLPYMFGSVTAWKFIIPFSIFQLVLMRLLPGKVATGPTTPAGNVPTYKANGLLSFVVTIFSFFVAAYGFEMFDPAEVYDHYLEIIGALNLMSIIVCLCLYLKGRCLPSSSDCGVSGNFIFDYYWGSELYPRIGGWDVKQFTNCRFGLMSWPLLILCFAAKQQATSGLSYSMIVSVALQLIYIAKFFHWEMGYMKSLDIMHDRAGFYLVSELTKVHGKSLPRTPRLCAGREREPGTHCLRMRQKNEFCIFPQTSALSCHDDNILTGSIEMVSSSS